MKNKLVHVSVYCLLIGIGAFLFTSEALAVPRVTGQLLNADGTPIPLNTGPSATLVSVYKTYEGRETLVGANYSTSEEGVFSVMLNSLGDPDGTVPLPRTLFVRVDSAVGGYPNYNPFDSIEIEVSSLEQVISVGDIQLKENNIQGVLVEPDGVTPVQAAGVYRYNSEDGLSRLPGAVTGDDGSFSMYMNPGTQKINFMVLTNELVSVKILTAEVPSTGDLDLGAVVATSSLIPLDEFYVPDHSSPENVQQQINTTVRTEVSKDTIGLNVHRALNGSDDTDGNYETVLSDSGTKWAREHFYVGLNPTESASWTRRYNKIINYYVENEIDVVGMLAYGMGENDYTMPSDLDAWSERVRSIVEKWGDYVRVWEIWNEPDLEKYLTPNSISNYIAILKAGYDAVKSVDPDAIVLSAPSSSPNASYLETLYQQAADYFDAPAFHVYYCDRYRSDGSLSALQRDFANTLAVVNRYRSTDNFWITELGCSTYSDYTDDFQNEYLQAVTSYLLSTNKVEKILLYTTLDRDINDPYEDNFGLLNLDFTPKPAWNWYASLDGGSASTIPSQYTAPVASGRSFFAYDSSIRGGYQLTAGNVQGNDEAEIITGTGDGMASHVRIFDKDGNRVSQFFAYDSTLRNGVTVSACDVNADGYDEIVTAQGQGGWPLVRIFDYQGNQVADEFTVLDGMYTGGVHLSCGDTDGDGTSEIVVAARHGGGPHVLVYNIDGRILTNFMAYDPNFRGGINVTTIDMDGDGKDEIVTGPQYGAPHVQIFQIRPNELKRLSPGFYAFNTDYRGGVQVSGLDTDGDGTKELIVGVGDNATPLVRRYNIREQLQQEFYAFGTNYLGGVMVGGGDIDADGVDEVLVMPRSGGGPNVRIIEVGDL